METFSYRYALLTVPATTRQQICSNPRPTPRLGQCRTHHVYNLLCVAIRRNFYEAVSYTWGNATQNKEIYFRDGARELLVRKNCYGALSHLRPKHEDRVLWIDANFIDQENLEEQAN